MKNMTEAELAYLAGIIDGEGNIAIHTRAAGSQGSVAQEYKNVMKVANTDLRLLEWIKEKTGAGSIYADRRRGNRRQCYQWFCPSVQAAKILRLVYPYLVIKKEQAELVFAFRETYDKHRYCRGGTPLAVVAVRKRHFEDLKALHHAEA